MRNLIYLFLLAPLIVTAQVNDKGTFHVALGISAGGHNTEYIQTINLLGVPIKTSNEDGAATMLYPIDVQFGIAKPVSLGLFLEPGAYLDSSNTRRNGLVLFGFQPRAYIINHDQFCWMASLQIGSAGLEISDSDAGVEEETRYAGPFFGLSSGVGFYFGKHFGLQAHARYMGSTLVLKEYTRNGTGVDLSSLEAELNTTGFALQGSLAFRF